MKENKEEFNKEFNDWLQASIKEHGSQWGFGFYIETIDNKVLYEGTDEYRNWRNNKFQEYQKYQKTLK